MKKTRRIAAMIAAMALTATMAVPSMMMSASAALSTADATKLAAMEALVTAAGNDATAVTDWGDYSLAEYQSLKAMEVASETAGSTTLTIKGVGSVPHTFEVYQIMTGTYNATEGTFSELKWGNGLTAYADDVDLTDNGGLVPDSVLTTLTTSGFDARTLITGGSPKVTLSSTKTTVTGTGDVTIYGLTPGYYIVKDTTNLDNKDDANSAWIIDIAGPKEINIKNETPTVDKEVEDETNETTNSGSVFGEAADHAINEQFKFKLTATIPLSDNLAAYDTYQLKFNDTMSAGVTFENIESVKISSATLAGNDALTLTTTQYTSTATANTAGLTWALTIADVKALVNANEADIFGKEEITVEVIYNAHLNENAIVDTASRSGGTAGNTNNNRVDLQYSNNPDNTGTGTNDLGQTPEDYVWVFTYEVDNTKYKISATTGNELPGAGFTLYSDSAKTTAIKLIDNGDGTYTVANQTATSGTITQMTSYTGTGIFNIKGLDAGTYYLSETDVPDGYNKADDITITIGATHTEETDGTAKLVLTGVDNGVENSIVNTKNSTLPSTGGMGTTLFILGGGVTAAAAGIYLVSKKRAKEEDAQ